MADLIPNIFNRYKIKSQHGQVFIMHDKYSYIWAYNKMLLELITLEKLCLVI